VEEGELAGAAGSVKISGSVIEANDVITRVESMEDVSSVGKAEVVQSSRLE
jgi:hypothetical protein